MRRDFYQYSAPTEREIRLLNYRRCRDGVEFGDNSEITLPPEGLITSHKIYDALGRVVVDLTPQLHSGGVSQIGFDGHMLPAGVYVCRAVEGGAVMDKMMMVVR